MTIQKGFEVRLASMLLVFAATLLAGFSALADELIMNDGSRLMGKVLKEDGGVVDFETSYAGTIKVKWSARVLLYTRCLAQSVQQLHKPF